MARTYNVIDADGHILEPVDIWEKYIDPAYRERAPKMIVDTDGKERLLVEGKILGSPATCVLSFTTSGTPCNGPSRLMVARSASAR